MRTALLSYSHHGRGMATTTRDLGHEIVAVMDAEQGPRQQLADEFQCPAYSSAGECLDASRPDAVLVAGKHTEMPDHVRACALPPNSAHSAASSALSPCPTAAPSLSTSSSE